MKSIPPTRPMLSTERRLILDRYQVCQVLGRGAMGEVFEAYDIQSETSVAIKHVTPEFARDPECVRQIRRNFSLASQLTHQHIASLRHLQADTESGQYYVIMDLVRGKDLGQWTAEILNDASDTTLRWSKTQGWDDAGSGKRDRASETHLPVELVVGIAEQIAAALDYAHSQPITRGPSGSTKAYGILHRDLKPTNVMVESEREYRPGIPFVRLVDFGLAAEIQASLDGRSQPNVKNEVTGTPFFMAPEQFLGRALTRGLDQWALAVMMYEMLTGRLPFPGPSILLVQAQVLACDPEPPAGLSSGQWAVLKRTFQRDRRLRHPSCMALVKAFADADSRTTGQVIAPVSVLPDELTGITDTAQGASPVEPEPTRTRKVPKAAVASIILLGIIVGAITLISHAPRPETRPSSQLAEQAIPPASTTEDQRPPAIPIPTGENDAKKTPDKTGTRPTTTKVEPSPFPLPPESGKTQTDTTPLSEKATSRPTEKTRTESTALEDMAKHTERLRTSAWPWEERAVSDLRAALDLAKVKHPEESAREPVRASESMLELGNGATQLLHRKLNPGDEVDANKLAGEWGEILRLADGLKVDAVRKAAAEQVQHWQVESLRAEIRKLKDSTQSWQERDDDLFFVEKWRSLEEKSAQLNAEKERADAAEKTAYYKASSLFRQALERTRSVVQKYKDLPPQADCIERRRILEEANGAWDIASKAWSNFDPDFKPGKHEIAEMQKRLKDWEAELESDQRKAAASVGLENGLAGVEKAIARDEELPLAERDYSEAQKALVSLQDMCEKFPDDVRAAAAIQVQNAKVKVGTQMAKAILGTAGGPVTDNDREIQEWRTHLALGLLSLSTPGTAESTELRKVLGHLDLFRVPTPRDAVVAFEVPDPRSAIAKLKLFLEKSEMGIVYDELLKDSKLRGELEAKADKAEKASAKIGTDVRVFTLGLPLGEAGRKLDESDYAIARSPDAYLQKVIPVPRDAAFAYRINLVAFGKGDALDPSRTTRRAGVDVTTTVRLAEAYWRAGIEEGPSGDLIRQVDGIGVRIRLSDMQNSESLRLDGRLWPKQGSTLEENLKRESRFWCWDTVRPISGRALLVVTSERENTALTYVVRSMLRGSMWEIGISDDARKSLDGSVQRLLSWCSSQITFAIDQDSEDNEVLCIVSGDTKRLTELDKLTDATAWAEKLGLSEMEPRPINETISDEAGKEWKAGGLGFNYKRNMTNRELELRHLNAYGCRVIALGEKDHVMKWLRECLTRLSRGGKGVEFASVVNKCSMPSDVGAWVVANPSVAVNDGAPPLWAMSFQTSGLAGFRFEASAQSVKSLMNFLRKYREESRSKKLLAPEMQSLWDSLRDPRGKPVARADRARAVLPTKDEERFIKEQFLPLAVALTISKEDGRKQAEAAGDALEKAAVGLASGDDSRILALLLEATRSSLSADGLEERIRTLRVELAKDPGSTPWREAMADVLLANAVAGGSPSTAFEHASGGIAILDQYLVALNRVVNAPQDPVHQVYVLLKCLQVRCAFFSTESAAKSGGNTIKAKAEDLFIRGFKDALPMGDKLLGRVQGAESWNW